MNAAGIVPADTDTLPGGELTFLLTDVEASTRIWDEHPDVMATALSRHDRLVAGAVTAHGGQVVRARGEGDSVFAVFGDPVDAVAAAAAIQRALFFEPWPEQAALRLRVGLHCGPSQLRDGSYYGTVVNRCARLRGIAHGGQVLLSADMVAQVEAALPPGAGLRDLGHHRLRDLSRPEHVFQLELDDVPRDFPPLQSMDTRPHNLPVQLTSFIGREREMAAVRRLLEGNRLVTLTGAGGCGKTRLALQVAAEMTAVFPDGVWLVQLDTVAGEALVPAAVASAVGVREEPGSDLTASLTASLAGRRALLLLDNCEHLVGPVATLVEHLLKACPALVVLATSREQLATPGEATWRVPSLEVGDGSRPGEAIQLFLQRAALRGIVLAGEQEFANVRDICGRLDGIPLAIELAAARTTVLRPDQILTRLDDRFRLLRGGNRTAVARQQTLEATVDWSYEYLDEPERRLLRRLSVFAGGCTLDGAEEVCADDELGEADLLDVLHQLVAKSLVNVDDRVPKAGYRLLETIRQYASARLVAAGEAEALRDRHLRWCVALAERAEAELRAGRMVMWTTLDAERDNFRAALEWGASRAGTADLELRLAASLAEYWDLRCDLAEGRSWLELALEAAPGAPTPLQAKARDGLAMLASHQGDYGTAAKEFETALAQARASGDRRVLSTTLGNLGWMRWSEGRAEESRANLVEGLAEARLVGDRWLVARALYLLAHPEVTEGGDHLEEIVSESLGIARALGEPSIEGRSIYFLGVDAMYHGEYEVSRAHLEASVACGRDGDDRWQVPWSLSFLGALDLLSGRLSQATAYLEEAHELSTRTGNFWCVARCLAALAWCRLFEGDTPAAVASARRSLELSASIGARIDTALAASFLGDVARAQGDLVEAERLQREALADNQAQLNAWSTAQGLERLARLALDRRAPARAAWLYGASDYMRELHRCPVPPISTAEVTAGRGTARAGLGDGFEAAFEAGRSASRAGGVRLHVPELTAPVFDPGGG